MGVLRISVIFSSFSKPTMLYYYSRQELQHFSSFGSKLNGNHFDLTCKKISRSRLLFNGGERLWYYLYHLSFPGYPYRHLYVGVAKPAVSFFKLFCKKKYPSLCDWDIPSLYLHIFVIFVLHSVINVKSRHNRPNFAKAHLHKKKFFGYSSEWQKHFRA